MLREQVIECEKAILTKLNFRLKSNTLAFWVDYFSLKWDTFLTSVEGEQIMREAHFEQDKKVKLRSSDGDCYRIYRQLV